MLKNDFDTPALKEVNDLLVQRAECLETVLLVVERYAIIAAMLRPHGLHIQSPALGVILVHFRAAHLQLQARGQDPIHFLLYCVFAPVSEGNIHVSFSMNTWAHYITVF